MQEHPLVSICIPTYNGAHLVPRALENCVKQTYPAVEILVIDDMSKDTTCEVVESYARRFPNIRLIKNEHNLGASKNFLKTFEMARGVDVRPRMSAHMQHLGVVAVECSFGP